MKGFKLPRKADKEYTERLIEAQPELGKVFTENLQGALSVIALHGHFALSSVYINVCEPLLCFEQQVNGYDNVGDVFLGISALGNSKNVFYVATANGMKVIGLTEAKDSKLSIFGGYHKSSRNGNIYDSGISNASLLLLVLDAGRYVFWRRI